MIKYLDGLPPFTFNAIVRYVRTSGKNIQLRADYMVMKLFERGVNFFIEGYLHNVFAKRAILFISEPSAIGVCERVNPPPPPQN